MEKHKINIDEVSFKEISQTIYIDTHFGGKKLIASTLIDLRKEHQTVNFEVWHKEQLAYNSSDIEKSINHYNGL